MAGRLRERLQPPAVGLTIVVLLAVAHAATHAVIRPLYQVSDEVVYLSTVQAAAIAAAGAGGPLHCLAPPAGEFPRLAASTKPGFLIATSLQLRTLCHMGIGEASLVWLRVLQSVSLGVVAACAWAVARLLTGRAWDAFLAGLIVAAHPVAATHAGAVTPDAWANAFSALALLFGTRLLLNRGGAGDMPLLVGSVVAAYAWKDSTGFLLALPVLVLALRAPGSSSIGAGWRRFAILGATSAIVVAAALFWFRTPYLAMAGTTERLTPASFGRAVLEDLLPQLGSLVASSWTALGNFGASHLSASATAAAIGVLLLALGIVGGCRRLARAAGPTSAVLLLAWAACAALCIVQPSVRQVLLGTQDVHQGRWLLPMLVPAAALLAWGLNGLSRTPGRGVLLCSVALLTAAWLGVLETVRFFWDAYPADLREPALYIRGTGGAVLDDTLILGVIRHAAAALPGAVPALSLTILTLLSAACCAFSFSDTAHPPKRLPCPPR